MQYYVQVLKEMFYEKCAYCESKIKHISPIHIEHFYPKSEFYNQMFEWGNWLLACPLCNSNKGSKFPYCDDNPCFIDPTLENPNEHIDFLDSQILSKSVRGEKTIKEIRLDRIPLTEERARWLNNIRILLLLVLRDPTMHSQVRNLLIWAMQPDAPYTGMTRAYLREKTPKLANPESPHPMIQYQNQIKQIQKLIEKYEDELKNLT
jgi:uncharacterized protein (TIGR02646 family)